MGRQFEHLDLIFIDFGDDKHPDPGKFYPVKLADSVAGDGADINGKIFDVYLNGFYAHNMPDWTSWNEALLKIEIKYSPQKEKVDEMQNAAFSLDFNVKDASEPGGFLHRKIFRKGKIDDELELIITLDEIDEKYDISQITSLVTDTSIGSYLDLSGYLQYIKLGTEIYNKIASMTVKNDPLWSDQITLKANNSLSGAAALKHGRYAFIATSDYKGRNLKSWKDDYTDVFYKGNNFHIGKQENKLQTNYLIFSIDFS